MSSDFSATDPSRGQLGWELILFAKDLRRLLDLSRKDYDEFLEGGDEIGGADIADPVNDLPVRLAVNRAIVGRIDRVLNLEATTRAFGTTGGPGDAEEVRHIAEGIVSVFSALLSWARDVRRAGVDPAWRPIYRAASNLARQPLRQIDEFVTDIETKARALQDDLHAGRTPATGLNLVLKITVDSYDLAVLTDSVAAADVVPRPTPRKSKLFRKTS